MLDVDNFLHYISNIAVDLLRKQSMYISAFLPMIQWRWYKSESRDSFKIDIETINWTIRIGIEIIQ